MLGWQRLDAGAATVNNWGCSTTDGLGPDGHLRFSWTPPVLAAFQTFLVTPGLRAAGAQFVTVQFEQQLNYDDLMARAPLQLGLYVLQDGNGNGQLEPAEAKVPVWLEPEVSADLEAGLKQVVIPAELLSDSLFVAFSVASENSHNLDFYDLDNVKICKGRAPQFVEAPTALANAWETEKQFRIKVEDPDATPLTFSIVEGSSFVTLRPASYSWSTRQYTLPLVVKPTTQNQIGSHRVVLEASDGCLSTRHTLDLTILITSGFLVWKPAVVPQAAGQALVDAIAATGEPVQLLEDLSLFGPLDKLSGLFITLGVYGHTFRLDALPAITLSRLALYLDRGGRVYLEGGDAWFGPGNSALLPYFQITALGDGSAGKYAGDLAGLNFAWGKSFSAAPVASLNSFLDRLTPSAGSSAKPILKPAVDSPGWHFMVAYDDANKKYRTIGSSIPFAALTDQGSGDRNDLMGLILDFFKRDCPACQRDEQCDDSVACSVDRCVESACVNSLPKTCITCVDDLDCPADMACVV